MARAHINHAHTKHTHGTEHGYIKAVPSEFAMRATTLTCLLWFLTHLHGVRGFTQEDLVRYEVLYSYRPFVRVESKKVVPATLSARLNTWPWLAQKTMANDLNAVSKRTDFFGLVKICFFLVFLPA